MRYISAWMIVLALLAASRTTTAQTVQLENRFLIRKVVVTEGRLTRVELRNKLAHKRLTPTGREEFRLRLSHGVDHADPDTLLTAADFEVASLKGADHAIVAEHQSSQHGLQVTVHDTLAADKSYGHKYLEISSDRPWTPELVDIEPIVPADAYLPYRAKDTGWTVGKFLSAPGQL
jgi:hypothetical protein